MTYFKYFDEYDLLIMTYFVLMIYKLIFLFFLKEDL